MYAKKQNKGMKKATPAETDKRYLFLEHTADAKFRAFGKTLEEAFGNAAVAMFSIMLSPEKIKPVLRREITAIGNDESALLYNFLEELLFLLDTEGFALREVRKIKIGKIKTGMKTSFALKASVSGDYARMYETHGDVKAITYNDMIVRKEDNRYMVQVVVDL
ncbi:MAG TPA: archease [Candidatus Nanoarchaeia archaeon]|nr:archease [Candidatus Nanoarchaeia archaeon]